MENPPYNFIAWMNPSSWWSFFQDFQTSFFILPFWNELPSFCFIPWPYFFLQSSFYIIQSFNVHSTIVAKPNGHFTRMWLLLVKKLLDTKRLVWKPYLGHKYFHMSILKALLLVLIKHGVHLIRVTMVANEIVNVKLLPQAHKIYSILLIFKICLWCFSSFRLPLFWVEECSLKI